MSNLLRNKDVGAARGHGTRGSFAPHPHAEADRDTIRPASAKVRDLPWSEADESHYDPYDAESTQIGRAPTSLTVANLDPGQRETLKRVVEVFEESLGLQTSARGWQNRHEFRIYPEDRSRTAVYVCARTKSPAESGEILRVVLDRFGNIHHLHQGSVDQYGTEWHNIAAATHPTGV